MTSQRINTFLLSRPYLAISSYGLALVVFVGIAGFSIFGVLESYRDRNEQWAVLERLTSRMRAVKNAVSVEAPSPSGPIFFEGETVAIAHASLLQRVAQGIARAGGTLNSSEVQADLPHEKANFIRVTAILEIEQGGLQPMIYSIETSEPMLLIENMLINGPSGGGGKLRVVMQISGQWAGAK